MKTALLVVLLCACVAVTLSASARSREPRSLQPQKGKEDGGWTVKADTTRNGGTVVRAEGNQRWDVTNDGKVKAEVHGHWERVYGGPNNGQRDRGVGGSVGGSWGK